MGYWLVIEGFVFRLKVVTKGEGLSGFFGRWGWGSSGGRFWGLEFGIVVRLCDFGLFVNRANCLFYRVLYGCGLYMKNR